MHLKQQPDMSVKNDIKIPIDHHQSNLPIVFNTACTKNELDMIRPHFQSEMVSFNCTLSSVTTGMLRLMNSNMTLTVTPR